MYMDYCLFLFFPSSFKICFHLIIQNEKQILSEASHKMTFLSLTTLLLLHTFPLSHLLGTWIQLGAIAKIVRRKRQLSDWPRGLTNSTPYTSWYTFKILRLWLCQLLSLLLLFINSSSYRVHTQVRYCVSARAEQSFALLLNTTRSAATHSCSMRGHLSLRRWFIS